MSMGMGVWKVGKRWWAPLVSVVGEGFFGSSEKVFPSRPAPLHSFLSVAVGAEVSMLLFNFCHNLHCVSFLLEAESLPLRLFV